MDTVCLTKAETLRALFNGSSEAVAAGAITQIVTAIKEVADVLLAVESEVLATLLDLAGEKTPLELILSGLGLNKPILTFQQLLTSTSRNVA